MLTRSSFWLLAFILAVLVAAATGAGLYLLESPEHQRELVSHNVTGIVAAARHYVECPHLSFRSALLGGSGDRNWRGLAMKGGFFASLFCLLVLFVVTFSRSFQWRKRLQIWGSLAAIAVLFVIFFRYRGVSGDLVPEFELRRKGISDLVSGQSSVDSATVLDYPQFLGPERNANIKGITLARDWTNSPPRLIWRRPVGQGWSGFVVAGNAAVTQEQRGEEESVVSYDLATGRVNWTFGYSRRYTDPLAGDGPRATPTISDGRVYTLGAQGDVHALALDTGHLLWSHQGLRDDQVGDPFWGMSGSPLVIDDLVVVNTGSARKSSLVAYDRISGDVVWRGGRVGYGYSSPQVVTLAGARQIIILNAGSVAAHDPSSGELLWSHPWPTGQPNIVQPIPISATRLLVSAGYGVGAKLFEVGPAPSGGLEAKLVWESLALKAKFSNVIAHEGFVYGLDGGILVCVDPRNGERRWKRGRYGHGQMILVEDLLLVQTEHGEIILVDPHPDELRELGRYRVLDGKTWNPPALAGAHLLVRSDREAALFELPVDLQRIAPRPTNSKNRVGSTVSSE